MCTYYHFYFGFKGGHDSISEQVVYCEGVKEEARKATEAAEAAQTAERGDDRSAEDRTDPEDAAVPGDKYA